MKINVFNNKKSNSEEKFSILIPTWNNLEYLKLCVGSIQKNSKYSHQIIIHVNDGSDGSLEWVKQQGFSYTSSIDNIGICWPLNSAATLSTTDYIVYFNDDMYALPNWDVPFVKEIESLNNDMFFISGTMIEPRESGNPCVIFDNRYGNTIENFDEELLLKNYLSLKHQNWTGATWPPNLVSKRVWNLVGGYSVEFSPGMYSDPDFSMKLWQFGVRHFKGLSDSRVFHFQCVSTGRIIKNNGKKQFQKKWNLSGSTFVKDYIHRGETWTGPVAEPKAKRGFFK